MSPKRAPQQRQAAEADPAFSRIFGAEGPLAQAIHGYQPRAGQAEMASAVAHALEYQGRLVVEAGTGTGKTLAYLVPALLSGRKILISTGTKALQEQLFQKDLPVARQAARAGCRVALLKGRANYLCLHRLELAEHDPRQQRPATRARLQQLRQWSTRTDSGDLAEIGDTGDGSPFWYTISSTAENCLGSECPQFRDCFVFRARKRAQESDVVVVNHHLLFADLALREEGFGELLPGADAIILDEAHQVPEIASNFFGNSLGSRQLLELARDCRAEQREAAADAPALGDALADLEAVTQGLEQALGQGQGSDRLPWAAVTEQAPLNAAVQGLQQSLRRLEATLEPHAARSKGLENCLDRSRLLSQRLDALCDGGPDWIRWIERYSHGFALNATPLDIAGLFGRIVGGSGGAWVFTSATLAVNRKFGHFTSRLGLEDPDLLIVDSPFDYRRNALLYLPAELPDPNDRGYTAAVVESALPLIQASGGGAFLLCTSYRAVQEAASLLRQALGLPLLVQGESGRSELLERFRAAGNAVLIGTSSFWEGVDVRGRALRLVIIDRLPFSSPGDPVLQARLEALRSQGADPFQDYQLPQAVIALKQGAGRLIRDSEDRGVLMLCDPRLRKRPYGRVFLASLPDMPHTREQQAAVDFLGREGQGA